MAYSLRSRRNLVCFYCNSRSNLKYDGFMTRWDCSQCESTNFLDKNGDITDPPVATDSPAPSAPKYAIPRSKFPSQGTDSSLFCNTCIKNQHLFTASLAQYEVDLNPGSRDYRQKEKEYFRFRNRLEKRYPQVCPDCEPRVLSRMNDASTAAKADHMRRMMDKTRARRSQRRSLTLPSAFETLGKVLWCIGLYGQLSWSVATLVASAAQNPRVLELIPQETRGQLGSILSTNFVDTWARYSLYSSIISLWWNPKFNDMTKGFVNHIVGFGEWYKLQILITISRCIFYSISGTGVLADTFAPPNIGAHSVIFLYILFLSNKAKRSLRVDMTPLWQATPEKLVNSGVRSSVPKESRPTNDLTDLLNSMISTPTNGRLTPSPSPPPYDRGGFDYQTPVPKSRPLKPLALSNSPETSVSRASTLFSTDHRSGTPQYQHEDEIEEMDWTFTQESTSPSQHRAFQPITSPSKQHQAFGQSPTGDQASVFWYKVPPEPITPAHRLRNPPNQPRLQVSSPETKENFFNNITRRSGLTHNQMKDETTRPLGFKQQKFFPSSGNESEKSLADMLTSFSLEGADVQTPITRKQAIRFRWDNFGQFVALALGLWFWNHAYSHPDENSKSVMLVVLVGSMAIGFRTILNCVLHDVGKTAKGSRSFGMAAGAIESLASLYGILEVLAGREDCVNCASLGSILLGCMLVQEFWFASFA